MLSGKHILVGVTGSIAAYKAAMLVRLLRRAGAEVRVVMTAMAREFVTPLTMATVAGNPILVDFFDPEDGRWNSHVSLGEWADAYVIAPATANTLGKMVSGVADNLLITSYLSARCPVFVAPAMDLDMYAHASTQANLRILRERGVGVIEPGEGELASGLVGKGRMAEPEEVVEFLARSFKKKTLSGRRFVVTAGPTVERVDPVRFLSNFSTGRMGYALAGELAARGAEVTLVSGPTSLVPPVGLNVVRVESAADMYEAVLGLWEGMDGGVLCAAVADYAPAGVSVSKLKKNGDGLVLPLTGTRDIAAELGHRKEGRLLVGFALETDDEAVNARGKLEAKNLDFIVLNSLRDEGAGFGGDTNKISIFRRGGGEREYPLMPKCDVAVAIVDEMEEFFL